MRTVCAPYHNPTAFLSIIVTLRQWGQLYPKSMRSLTIVFAGLVAILSGCSDNSPGNESVPSEATEERRVSEDSLTPISEEENRSSGEESALLDSIDDGADVDIDAQTSGVIEDSPIKIWKVEDGLNFHRVSTPKRVSMEPGLSRIVWLDLYSGYGRSDGL